jgi:putative phosphoesterase
VRPPGGSVLLGVVADLHGRFDPLLPAVLAGVERILVAGDTVDEALLARLERIAPVLAVRGNNDHSPGLRRLPEFLTLEAAGRRLLMAHDARDRRLARELGRVRPDILIVGHSHMPLSRRESGLWTINPGSAGPKRFHLPRTAGTLRLSARARLRLWDLERNAAFRWPRSLI